MRNLIPTSREPFDFHVDVINSKRNQELISNLRAVDNLILEQFASHEECRGTNTLESIMAGNFSEEIKIQLRNLYTTKSSVILRLKKELLTSDNNRATNTCQYCTVNAVGAMDHIMPKANFPEFTVHVHNLFPCCSQCNELKSNTWLKDGKRQFLNLYLDILPSVRYLFTEVLINEGAIVINFNVDNRNSIDEGLFEVIESHYTKLRLPERFSNESNNEITNLRNTLTSLPNRLSRQEVVSFVNDSAQRNMDYLGTNHWKSVLVMELINNDDFLSSCGF